MDQTIGRQSRIAGSNQKVKKWDVRGWVKAGGLWTWSSNVPHAPESRTVYVLSPKMGTCQIYFF